jgi:hypothetical protein
MKTGKNIEILVFTCPILIYPWLNKFQCTACEMIPAMDHSGSRELPLARVWWWTETKSPHPTALVQTGEKAKKKSSLIACPTTLF